MGGIFTLMDEHGFFNVWSGQSHGAHYLYFILWKPAQAIAGDRLYFSTVFALLWYVISMGSLFLGFHYFYGILEHLWEARRALVVTLVYILVALAVQWYTVTDSITITGVLGAIYFLLKGRSKTGGILLGVTATLKPMGLLLLPVVLKSRFISFRARLGFIVASLLSYILLLIPFAAGNFKIFTSSLNWQGGRPPWETAYAFVMWALNKPFPDVNPFFVDYSGISPRDWGWTGITPVHQVMTTIVPATSQWYNMVFFLLFAALVGAFVLLRRIDNKEEFLWGYLVLLLGYFVAFYGWSAQFVYWLLPLLLICFPIVAGLGVRVLTLIEYPFFYGLYLARVAPDLVTAAAGLTQAQTQALAVIGPPGFWTIILLRTALFIALAVIAWFRLPGHIWLREWDWQRIRVFIGKLTLARKRLR
jgi:hypothetical protein